MIMETIGGTVERDRLTMIQSTPVRGGSLARTANPKLVEKRRRELQDAHDAAMRKESEDSFVFSLAIFPAVIGWVVQPQGGWQVALVGYSILAVIVTCMSVGFGIAALRRVGEPVMVMSTEGNDPTGLVPALDALYDALRSPSAGRARILASYDAVVDRMQDLVPGRPLSRLVARGYRPSEETDDSDRKLDYDKDPDERHWERSMEATDRLRALLTSEGWITQRDVLRRVSALVAPLRAVLRARDVPTWRIEYEAPPMTIARDALHDTAPAVAGPLQTRAVADMRADIPPIAEDAVTAVENRLNATGAMMLASLRPLTTAFRSADPNLFLGDDRGTGESMIESHLPRLVDAFVVADDASSGPERDAVRADFARSLGFLRDSMAGIMERHAQAARENLRVQARFVETRHGQDGPLP